MIEKWRPAKDGDSGLVRYRASTEEFWTYNHMDYMRFDSDGFLWIGDWHFQDCEVLEAYMSDEEVFQLEHAISREFLDEHDEELHGGLTRMRIGQIIRQHFASEANNG